jgi:hypothetical protein
MVYGLGDRLSLSLQRPLNFGHTLAIRFGKAVQKMIRADVQGMAKTREGRDGKGRTSLFQMAHCLPMDTKEFRDALLGQSGLLPSRLGVLGDDLEDLAIGHRQVKAELPLG